MPAPKKVFIVEHRRGYEIDTVVAHIASSEKKAHAFIMANQDFDSGTDWWWAVYSNAVDSNLVGEVNDLHFVLPSGAITYDQPVPPHPEDRIEKVTKRMTALMDGIKARPVY